MIVPTVEGRSRHLRRCKLAYASTTPDYELLVLEDYETCGQAWNVGIEKAKGQFIHLSADDLEPHQGWWKAAISALNRHVLPCPLILTPEGDLESCGDFAREERDGAPSAVARIPFLPRDLALDLHPVFDRQYMGDYWIAREAGKRGWPTVVVRKYLFTHHMASEGRLETLREDIDVFEAL